MLLSSDDSIHIAATKPEVGVPMLNSINTPRQLSSLVLSCLLSSDAKEYFAFVASIKAEVYNPETVAKEPVGATLDLRGYWKGRRGKKGRGIISSHHHNI